MRVTRKRNSAQTVGNFPPASTSDRAIRTAGQGSWGNGEVRRRRNLSLSLQVQLPQSGTRSFPVRGLAPVQGRPVPVAITWQERPTRHIILAPHSTYYIVLLQVAMAVIIFHSGSSFFRDHSNSTGSWQSQAALANAYTGVTFFFCSVRFYSFNGFTAVGLSMAQARSFSRPDLPGFPIRFILYRGASVATRLSIDLGGQFDPQFVLLQSWLSSRTPLCWITGIRPSWIRSVEFFFISCFLSKIARCLPGLPFAERASSLSSAYRADREFTRHYAAALPQSWDAWPALLR